MDGCGVTKAVIQIMLKKNGRYHGNGIYRGVLLYGVPIFYFEAFFLFTWSSHDWVKSESSNSPAFPATCANRAASCFATDIAGP